jgi:hypothetical protein
MFFMFVLTLTDSLCCGWFIQDAPGGKVNILGGHSIGHFKQKVHMYMCPTLKGFQDRAMDVIAHMKERQDALIRATCHVLT